MTVNGVGYYVFAAAAVLTAAAVVGLRSVHRAEGWTCETIASQAMPALKASFYPLDRSADVFSWDPI